MSKQVLTVMIAFVEWIGGCAKSQKKYCKIPEPKSSHSYLQSEGYSIEESPPGGNQYMKSSHVAGGDSLIE